MGAAVAAPASEYGMCTEALFYYRERNIHAREVCRWKWVFNRAELVFAPLEINIHIWRFCWRWQYRSSQSITPGGCHASTVRGLFDCSSHLTDVPSEFAHQNERKRDCDASTADSVPTPLIRRRSETMRDGKRGQVIYANAKSTCPQIILNEDARVVCGIFLMEL